MEGIAGRRLGRTRLPSGRAASRRRCCCSRRSRCSRRCRRGGWRWRRCSRRCWRGCRRCRCRWRSRRRARSGRSGRRRECCCRRRRWCSRCRGCWCWRWGRRSAWQQEAPGVDDYFSEVATPGPAGIVAHVGRYSHRSVPTDRFVGDQWLTRIPGGCQHCPRRQCGVICVTGIKRAHARAKRGESATAQRASSEDVIGRDNKRIVSAGGVAASDGGELAP